MSEKSRPRQPDELALAWQALAERRREQLLRMYTEGRWSRYFSEDRISTHMRDTVDSIERWSALTKRAPKKPGFPPEMLPGAAPDLPLAAE
jgi:hypothetical protein